MKRATIAIAATLVCAGSGTIHAQESLMQSARDALGTRPLRVEVGAGVANFTEGGTQTITDPGAMWTLRGILGADQRLSFELGYTGSARPVEINAIGDAAVLHTGFEALVRLGYHHAFASPMFVNPYAGAGLGWGVYNLVGESGAVPGLTDADGVFTLPLALGVTAGYDRVNLDLRFAYRPAWGDEMFSGVYQGLFSDGLNTLSFTAAAGWSF